MPHDPFHRGLAISWFGVLLLAMGVWWLLDILGYTEFNWAIVGAMALIAVGLSMIVGRIRWSRRFG